MLSYVRRTLILTAATLMSVGVCAEPPLPAFAQPGSTPKKPELAATNAKLTALSTSERALLAPMLKDGPIVMAPFYDTALRLPSVTVAFNAPLSACKVYKMLAKPEDYPSFMPALSSTKVTARHKNSVAYDWHWFFAIFNLKGTSFMTRSVPRSSKAPYRVEIRNTGGDLGVGRMLWRIYPAGPGSSVVTLSARFDMRESNFVTEKLAAGGATVVRTIAISLTTVMALGARAEAYKRNGKPFQKKRKDKSKKPLTRPDVNPDTIHQLLARGDLVTLKLNGDDLEQINVIGRSGYPLAETRKVLTTPEEFGKALIKGSTTKVLEKNEAGTLFEWRVPVPLMSVWGKMRAKVDANEGKKLGKIHFSGVEGGLKSGRWHFDTHVFPWGESAIVGWGLFDPAESAALIRAVIAGDKHFSHGLAASMEVMIMRSLRTRLRKARAEKHEKARAARTKKQN